MLRYDNATERFIHGTARFGKGSPAAQLAADLSMPLEDFTGLPGWQQIELDDGELEIGLTFKDGLLHSGTFVADVPLDGGWDVVQDRRRAAHEALMQQLFGTQSYESRTLLVYLFRNPRDGIEQIMFEVR